MNIRSANMSDDLETSNKAPSIIFQNISQKSKNTTDTYPVNDMVIQEIRWQSVADIPLTDMLEDRYGHIFANWVMERVP